MTKLSRVKVAFTCIALLMLYGDHLPSPVSAEPSIENAPRTFSAFSNGANALLIFDEYTGRNPPTNSGFTFRDGEVTVFPADNSRPVHFRPFALDMDGINVVDPHRSVISIYQFPKSKMPVIEINFGQCNEQSCTFKSKFFQFADGGFQDDFSFGLLDQVTGEDMLKHGGFATMFRPGTVVGIAKASDGTTIIGTDYCGVSNVILNLPNDRRIKDGIARDLHVGLLVRTYDRVKDSAREHALSYITRKGGFDCL